MVTRLVITAILLLLASFAASAKTPTDVPYPAVDLDRIESDGAGGWFCFYATTGVEIIYAVSSADACMPVILIKPAEAQK